MGSRKLSLWGVGVPNDMGQAVAWYRKAAEQGDPKAQFALGTCYRLGKGVEKDKVTAPNSPSLIFAVFRRRTERDGPARRGGLRSRWLPAATRGAFEEPGCRVCKTVPCR